MVNISEIRAWLHEELLGFAWSQWVQMGLSGHPSRQDQWAMDPEALLLFSLEIARLDPRLFDELLDWLRTNGRLMILQRVRNLEASYPGDPVLVHAALASASAANRSLRWPDQGHAEHAEAEVFPRDRVAFVPEQDEVFQRFGFRRPPVVPSHGSRTPVLTLPVNFAFRLRLLFGAGTRSEVMRLLLTDRGQALDGSRITQDAAFARRNVSEALSALTASGVVKARWSANQRVYRVFPARWAQVLGIAPTGESLPLFVPWISRLFALLRIDRWLDQVAEGELSDYLLASEARKLVLDLSSQLESAGLDQPDPRSYPGTSYWPAFENMVRSLVQMLHPDQAARSGRAMRSPRVERR